MRLVEVLLRAGHETEGSGVPVGVADVDGHAVFLVTAPRNQAVRAVLPVGAAVQVDAEIIGFERQDFHGGIPDAAELGVVIRIPVGAAGEGAPPVAAALQGVLPVHIGRRPRRNRIPAGDLQAVFRRRRRTHRHCRLFGRVRFRALVSFAFEQVRRVGVHQLIPLGTVADCGFRGDESLVVPGVEQVAAADLLEHVRAAGAVGRLPGLVQRRKQDGGQNRNDRNYHYDYLLNIQYGVY